MALARLHDTDPRHIPPVSPGWSDLVPALRRAGHRSRLHRPANLDEDPVAVLLDALPAALGRRLVFHEPGAPDISFDEAWLANALDAVRQSDQDRYAFALRSRLRPEPAARLHVLVCRAAHSLDRI